jgi:FMN hydrolase / 5-amino-6-(5-phospho-D-ribitylamino)uracil phosphatase
MQAVLFDGDQTLWDFQLVMRRALAVVLDEVRTLRPGPKADRLSVDDAQVDRDAVAAELGDSEFNLVQVRKLGLARTLARLRPPSGPDEEAADWALVDELTSLYLHHRDIDPALFPDTLPCLNVLRPHYRLGLLTNGNRQPDLLGLGGYFETIVFAQDHRVAKPDRGIFEVVERQLGLAPEHCVLVGDHPVNDVVGAKRSGWRAVWLHRGGDGAFYPQDGHPEEPDAVIGSLTELPAALAAL